MICPTLEQQNSPAGFEYRVDKSYDYYLENWYSEMDLVCANMVAINFMVSARYIAYGVAGLFLFAMPDKYGRKWTIAITSAIMIVAQFLMIFVPTYEARLVGFIFFGLTMLKATVPYIYISELVPPKHAATVSVTMTSFDSATLLIFNLYLLFISRYWLPLVLTMTILASLALVCAVFILPESPSWLIA